MTNDTTRQINCGNHHEKSLDSRVAEIITATKDANLEVINGWIDAPEDATVVIHDSPAADNHLTFIQHASKIGATFIVLHVGKLHQDEFNEAYEFADEAEESEAKSNVLKELEGCQSKIGQIEQIVMVCFMPGSAVRMELSFEAPWREVIYNTQSILDGELDTNEGREISDGLADEKVEQLAHELAALPRFQAAKNNEAKTLEARKHLRARHADEDWQWRLREIVQTAKSIFENELRPVRDAQFRQQAEECLREGESKSAVARKLGITPQQLSKLL